MIRVLLADDTPEMRLLLRVTLESDGRFEVVADASDGREVLALLEAHEPDLLVLDMAMPEMDGLEVLNEIRNRGLRLKVLAFSGFDDGVEREARRLGARDYMRKGNTPIQDIVPRLLALTI